MSVRVVTSALALAAIHFADIATAGGVDLCVFTLYRSSVANRPHPCRYFRRFDASRRRDGWRVQ